VTGVSIAIKHCPCTKMMLRTWFLRVLLKQHLRLMKSHTNRTLRKGKRKKSAGQNLYTFIHPRSKARQKKGRERMEPIFFEATGSASSSSILMTKKILRKRIEKLWAKSIKDWQRCQVISAIKTIFFSYVGTDILSTKGLQ
jgi:hypothetical protein